jgi:hypothetical protein
VSLRIVLACVLLGALVGGGVAAAEGRDYRARSFVIRVPPAYGDADGLRFAQSDPVLRRALRLAGIEGRDPDWLRRRSSVQLTSRLDFAITVETPLRGETRDLATAYAKAVKRSLRAEPGLVTLGRGARDAQLGLGPVGWGVIGAAAGLWLGAALAIVRSGSARAARRASPPCASETRATPG